jgi:hypothetical protein
MKIVPLTALAAKGYYLDYMGIPRKIPETPEEIEARLAERREQYESYLASLAEKADKKGTALQKCG